MYMIPGKLEYVEDELLHLNSVDLSRFHRNAVVTAERNLLLGDVVLQFVFSFAAATEHHLIQIDHLSLSFSGHFPGEQTNVFCTFLRTVGQFHWTAFPPSYAFCRGRHLYHAKIQTRLRVSQSRL